MTAKAIRDEALALPVAQRLSLVAELWDSIAADQKSLPLSEDHARIIDERLGTDAARDREVVAWEDAVKEARRRVAKKRKMK